MADPEKVKALLAYCDAWQARHNLWLDFIDREFKRRYVLWYMFLRQARVKLAKLAEIKLKVSRDGTIDSLTGKGKRAADAFRKESDKIFVSIFNESQRLFGYKVSWKAGIAIGNLDKATMRFFHNKLKEIMQP